MSDKFELDKFTGKGSVDASADDNNVMQRQNGNELREKETQNKKGYRRILYYTVTVIILTCVVVLLVLTIVNQSGTNGQIKKLATQLQQISNNISKFQLERAEFQKELDGEKSTIDIKKEKLLICSKGLSGCKCLKCEQGQKGAGVYMELKGQLTDRASEETRELWGKKGRKGRKVGLETKEAREIKEWLGTMEKKGKQE